MKTKEFFDLEQAQRYLSNNVIRLGDNLIYIVDINKATGAGKFVLKYIQAGGDGKQKSVNLGHPDLDMTPFKLGMLSVTPKDKYCCLYAWRYPYRVMAIGLTHGNLGYKAITSTDRSSAKLLNVGSNNFLMSDTLLKTFRGDYPDVEEAEVYALANKDSAFAFDRNFCVVHREGKSQLIHKNFNVPVGEVNKGQPTLGENFFFLKEVLNEAVK